MPSTDQQPDIRSLARKFARREIAPFAAEWDRFACFPREVVKRMGDVRGPKFPIFGARIRARL
jgi:alkylation response protein AidB-like acyl-CoA dehydrogenase